MAASPSSPAKFVFEPNVPQLIALKWTSGKQVQSQYSEQPQVMFSLVDGRTLYVSQSVATSIANLQLGNREPFNICMRWNGEKTQQRRYDVWLTTEGEKDRAAMEMAASPLEEALEASLDKREEDIKAQLTAQLAAIQQRKTAQAAPPVQPQGPVAVPARNPGLQGWTSFLLSQTNSLIDVYAQACKHAESQGVPPAVVRTVMLSAFIGLQKKGNFDGGGR